LRSYGHVVVAAARWESDSIVEWLNYYRFIGFDHAYIYCNDDTPEEMYEAVLPYLAGPDPFVTFHHYPIRGLQHAMYEHFLDRYVEACEWFAFIDLDEFILIRHHDTIRDFIASFPIRPDAIAFNNVTAGHNGHVVRPTGSVIANYTRRRNRASKSTKNIARSDAFAKTGLRTAFLGGWFHNIEAILKDDAIIINVLGHSTRGFYGDQDANWATMSTPEFHEDIIETAFIYHVRVKSEADLLRRAARGVDGQFYGQDRWRAIHEQGPQAVAAYLAPQNVAEETRLLAIRRAMLRDSSRDPVVPLPPGRNLALGRPATQSSTCRYSLKPDREADAAGVVSGKPDGYISHHTDFETAPWWQVDLGEAMPVREVRVFKRLDRPERSRSFEVVGSVDGAAWTTLFDKADEIAFGGVDGDPFIWREPSPVSLRFLRVIGHGWCCLDLDQVEIYETVSGCERGNDR